jgi:AraC-like DNA-binding protein
MQEWSIHLGQQLLKGYFYPSSPKARYHQFTDDQSFGLVLALSGDVYADGVKISPGRGRLLPVTSSAHFLIFHPGTESILMLVPGTPGSFGHSPNSQDVFTLSTVSLYHLARLLILVTQVPRSDMLLQPDAVVLVRCCFCPQSPDLTPSIRFDEMYRLVNTLFTINGKVNAKTTVSQLAVSSQLKTYRLQQICQQAFGLTANQLLRFMKMNTALNTISDPSLTLAAISSDLGYSNDENLITAFRGFYGITPHALRKALPHLQYAATGKL